MRGGIPRAARSETAPSTMRATVRRVAVLALAALAALGAGACSEKIATVDPGFTAPEGAASLQTGLVAWRETPNHIYVFTRGDPDAVPPVPDVLAETITIASSVPGQFHGAILDSTPANAYQVFRREPNGGYRELYDFAAVPARRWIDRGWEVYHFTDADTAVPTHTYRGRGIVGGGVTLASPLTNEASGTVTAVPNIAYTGKTGFNAVGNPEALDSLFVMEWRPVTNAVAYIIHVYQWSFNMVNLEEQIMSGMPAPLFIGKSRDILAAYLPAPSPPGPTVSFCMRTPDGSPGSNCPPEAHHPEARIMTVRQTRYGQEYLVRISAVDALGQLIAYTYGSYSQELTDIPGGITLPASQFAVFPLGAVKVVPSRPRTAAPAFPRRPETLQP